MNETEIWFMNEFGRFGFTLSQTVYDPMSFTPMKLVMYKGFRTRVHVTPEMVNDLSGGFVSFNSVNNSRQIIREQLNRLYPEAFGPKDFTPIEKLSTFRFT